MDVIRKDEICSFNCSLNKHKSSLRYDFALCSKYCELVLCLHKAICTTILIVEGSNLFLVCITFTCSIINLYTFSAESLLFSTVTILHHQ